MDKNQLFKRQITLSEIGEVGQQKLQTTRQGYALLKQCFSQDIYSLFL